MSILQNSQKKMFSNENSKTAILLQNFFSHPMIFFFKFFGSKLNFLLEKTDINLVESVMELWFLQFLEWSAYSTTQFMTSVICHQQMKISDTSLKYTIGGAWVRVNRGQIYTFLQSNTA